MCLNVFDEVTGLLQQSSAFYLVLNEAVVGHLARKHELWQRRERANGKIPIAEEDKPKTAITTPFGLYEFNVMSFGLRNVPSTFQRFIPEVLRGMDFVFPYLDDVLIA
ncbi:transposon Ty3-I Gag-Pol polyprotein [Trichonephila clavata]|uniref:Transposon Ty3-I Gag-Pol polyprotein n=1 Tax=Trichonephila clavata TaxID=2740835 RepID=A0A8X6K8S0_TRICU|nr:transposon Ty3-I Gag-Pol polyprotein [Trichonephila clavata]